jgi:putative membrane protein
MKKLHLLYLLMSVLMLTTVACDDDDDEENNTIAQVDRQFVLSAADGNLFEINSGQVASSKGTAANIKSYGQMMVTDHTAASQELMTLAGRKNVEIPTTLSDAKQDKLDSLATLTGVRFDSVYVNMMVVSHKETVTLFERESTGGSDAELKTWATSKLPALRHHLEMAEALKDSLDK